MFFLQLQNLMKMITISAIKWLNSWSEGGWHIQIDADEYFLDFKGFVDFLIKLNDNPKTSRQGCKCICKPHSFN